MHGILFVLVLLRLETIQTTFDCHLFATQARSLLMLLETLATWYCGWPEATSTTVCVSLCHDPFTIWNGVFTICFLVCAILLLILVHSPFQAHSQIFVAIPSYVTYFPYGTTYLSMMWTVLLIFPILYIKNNISNIMHILEALFPNQARNVMKLELLFGDIAHNCLPCYTSVGGSTWLLGRL